MASTSRRRNIRRQCLMARRLVERGVRFVQIYSGGGNFTESWDRASSCESGARTHEITA